MIKIILNGYMGKMGHIIANVVKNYENCEIIAGADVRQNPSGAPFPTYADISACDLPADVIIDFSTAGGVPGLVNYAVERKIPAVICTTGLDAQTIEKINKASGQVAIFRSANMSLGINVLSALLAKVSKIFANAKFDIEIIEKHHNQKIDAPSGTAIMLADAVNSGLEQKLEYVYGRRGGDAKRKDSELGIHALRGGTVVGEHSVIFAGQDEVVEFTHIAQSKEVFAAGAVNAALYLAGKPAGLYTMNDLTKELLEDI